MIHNRYSRLLLAAFLLASCSKEGLRDEPQDTCGVVLFGASDWSPFTRAEGEVSDVALDGFAFGVFAYDTGRYPYTDSNVNPNFMYNERVSYDGTSGLWGYSPVKYWPNGEGEVSGITGSHADYVSFFAYAPHSDRDPSTAVGYCVPTVSDQEEVGNPWVVYRIHEDVSEQVDLLYAPCKLDLTKQDVDGKVTFQFRHALACVGEKAYVSCGPSLQAELEGDALDEGCVIRVVLDDVRVTYTLTERAKLLLWNTGDVARWQALLNGEPTTERTVVYGEGLGYILFSTDPGDATDTWESADGNGVFYIPLDLPGHPQTAAVTVTYKVVRIGGTTVETQHVRQASIRLSSYPESFAPGKKLSALSFSLNGAGEAVPSPAPGVTGSVNFTNHDSEIDQSLYY